jgi:hypothetical protein
MFADERIKKQPTPRQENARRPGAHDAEFVGASCSDD